MAGRSVLINLIGNNRTGSAFRGAARDTDRFRDRLDRLNKSSLSSSTAVQKLTGRTATLAAGMLAVAPAAGAAATAVVAGTGAMTAAFGAAGVALGAFTLAAGPQLKKLTGDISKLPPATRKTAKEFKGLKREYAKWSDALAGDTMPVFTKGLQAARVVLPKLTKLVKTGAGALDDFMDSILRGVGSKGFDAFLDRTNEAAKKVLPALLNSVKNVGKGLAGMFDAFLPHAPKMASGIEGLTRKFAEWGQSLGQSKAFTEFMDRVRQNLPALSVIFGNLVVIAGNLAEAFAPMTGMSLTLVKHFTGMLAALPPEALTALATGFIAISGALRILIPLQRAFNLVLALNPIGIVVLALAGLALGLVAAYRKSETFRRIVDGAFRGAADTVSRAWKGPFGTALKEMAAFLEVTLIPRVTDLVGSLAGVGDQSIDAGGKLGLLGQAFQGVNKDGAGTERLMRTGLGGAIGSLAGPLGIAVGLVGGWFWPEIKKSFTDGIVFIRDRWRNWALDMLVVARDKFVQIGDTVGRGLTGLKTRLTVGLPPLRATWSSFWNWSKVFAGNVWDTLVAGTRKFLRDSRDAFAWGVGAIRSAWGKLKAAAKDPVNFVIGTVHNKGVVGLINKIADFAGIDKRMGKLPLLERGGTLTNPLGVRPMKTNGPMAIVGEGRQAFPEYVIPTDPKFRGRAQGLWAAAGRDLLSGGRNWTSRLGGEGIAFERGGTIPMLASGGIIGGFMDKLKGFSFPDPAKAFKAALGRIIGAVPGRGLFRDVVAGIPPWIGKQLVTWFKSKVDFGGKGVGKALAWAKTQNRKPYQWGGIGNPSWDCSGFMSGIVNVLKGRSPFSRLFTTMSFTGARSGPQGFVRDARSGFRVGVYNGASPRDSHMAGTLGRTAVESSGSGGVRVGGGARGADNGMFNMRYGLKYDQGGMLQPGVTLAVNKTGRPEPVFPSTEAAAAYGGRGTTVNQYFDVHVEDRADVNMVMQAAEFEARSASFA